MALTNEDIIKELEKKQKKHLADHSNKEGDEFWRRGEMHALDYTLHMLRSVVPEQEGTKVWVSWDSKQNDTPPFISGLDSNPYISSGGHPEARDIGGGLISWTLLGGSEQFTKIDSDLAALLGVKPGECKAFYIKEADDGGD